MSDAIKSEVGLKLHDITGESAAYWNMSIAGLIEESIQRREGIIAENGSLVCLTGQHTGRSPNDKFVVRESSSEGNVWWGPVNRPIEARQFDKLHKEILNYLKGKELFVRDAFAGADSQYRLPIRVITETAWHNLFARHMFIEDSAVNQPGSCKPEFVVINVPGFKANPSVHGTNSEVFVLVNFAKRLVLIGGTSYAGEIKKSIFTVMNYLLPLKGVMPMHCSANIGVSGDTALFFGLSGTGKTTLSSDPERQLIGDDEHGWSDRGIFNLEGGCYAKMIRLSDSAEPQIYAATRRFGTILENVVIDSETHQLDLDDESLTENTRGAYPISFIENSVSKGVGGHPRNIVMLTADAFGVLPPISKLTPAAAKYHFLSGYTAKVAGTERGVTEPKVTFSTCFGAPFMVWHPNVYAKFLGEKIAKHEANVWLVNTGWTGGPYGTGSRMKIEHTRAMLGAVLSGALDGVQYDTDPFFNVQVPLNCPGVPEKTLRPRLGWSDPEAYDVQAAKLAQMFVDNFKDFEDTAEPDVKMAGPSI